MQTIRKKINKSFGGIFLVMLLLLVNCDYAYACCGFDSMPVAERAEKMKAIFIGEIKKIEEVSRKADIITKIASVKVKRVIKGEMNLGEEVSIHFKAQMKVPRLQESCDENLIDLRAPTDDMIFYVDRENGEFFTTDYFGTDNAKGSEAKKELAEVTRLLSIQK
jgi:hypothetical protein